jgi:hypothetical protein
MAFIHKSSIRMGYNFPIMQNNNFTYMVYYTPSDPENMSSGSFYENNLAFVFYKTRTPGRWE